MALKNFIIDKAMANLSASKVVQKLSSSSLDLKRVELANRRFLNRQSESPNTINNHLGNERYDLLNRRNTQSLTTYTNLNIASKVPQDIVQDNIIIIDLDADNIDQGIKKITLPFIPREVNWNSDSNFVAIKPVGRNNPKYHYTGSEDKLEFEIDWHSFDENRDDVIKGCRLLEALSKGDAYNKPPHRVIIQWGSEDVLFRDMVFIIISAPYRMTQFNKAQSINNNVSKTALLPVQAYQKITLARITSNNLSTKDIQLVQSTKYY